MTITTLSSREFDRDITRAKSRREATCIHNRSSRPEHVLLYIDEYRRLTSGQVSLGEALAQPDVDDFEFTPPRVGNLLRTPDMS